MSMILILNCRIAEQKKIVTDSSDPVPDRIIPGSVHMIPVSVNLNHIPSVVHAVAAHQHARNIELTLHHIGKRLAIAVTYAYMIHQCAICSMRDSRNRICV